MKAIVLVSLAILVAACTASIPKETSTIPSVEASVSVSDFEPIIGTGWTGSLNYLDYSSGKIVEIPVELDVSVSGSQAIVYEIQYPGESQHNSKEKLVISDGGHSINGQSIVELVMNDEGISRIVTASRGRDENRNVDIQMTYSFTGELFEIQKKVRVDGEADWFVRNRYVLSR